MNTNDRSLGVYYCVLKTNSFIQTKEIIFINNMRSVIILLFSFLFFSCEKEDFPRKKELIGTWIEETSSQNKAKLKFTDENLYIIGINSIDTFNYYLDNEREALKLFFKNNLSAGESSHNILNNKRQNELSITSIIPSTDDSYKQFKKE